MYEFKKYGCDICYASVSDWLDKFEEDMSKAIESNEPFDTGWAGCKKEIESFRIVRNEDGDIYIEVWEGMDEGTDLVDDAIWDVFGEDHPDANDSDVYGILDILWNDWDFKTEVTYDCDFSFKENSTTAEKIQQLKDALDEQIAFTHKDLECSYNFCKGTVEEYFTEKYGWKKKEK